MTHSANPAQALDNVHRLLGHPSDLKGHLDVHGPLNVAPGRKGSWQQGLMTSLEASGLTGRGGGAFPTSIKLGLAQSAGTGGTIVVNAMEGEPASDKDALLLTRTPHLALDGAQYLAALCGAARIVVCIPIGSDYVAAAVRQAITARARDRYAPVREEIRPTTRPLHRRRGIGAGQLDRDGTLATGFPAGQERTTSHRQTPRAGAQRGDLGPRRPHCSARCGTLPGPRDDRGARDQPGDDQRQRETPRGGGGRSGYPAVGHCHTEPTRRARAGTPGRWVRRDVGRP